MLKKIIFCYALLHVAYQVDAQFFRGIGLFIGGTTSSHRYVNGLEVDSFLFTHTTPAPSHRSAEYISYSGGFFVEFLRYEHIRWQTEFEYCTKRVFHLFSSRLDLSSFVGNSVMKWISVT